MEKTVAQQKSAVAWLSVVSNSSLVGLKLVVGLAVGSVSVVSEAIHSGVDLVASVIALAAVKTASKPPDEEHPFGHGKIENISGTVEALLIFGAAAWIIHEAIKKLLHPGDLHAIGWGVGVMLFSSLANLTVSEMLFRVGRRTESIALQADGWHLRTDVWTSAGVMAGLAVIWLGDRLLGVHLRWVDPVAAIMVALLILRAAWVLTVESARDLMDISLPAEEQEWIRNYLSGLQPAAKGFHALRTRKGGAQRFVQFHLIVDRTMSVEESHEIAERAAGAIEAHFPNCHVSVHVEPCDGSCKPACREGCFLPAEEREKVRGEGLGGHGGAD